MDTLRQIKDLVEKISTDTYKVYEKGNHSASIRARKNAQLLKELIVVFRKDILTEIKKHDESRIKTHKKSRYNSYQNLKRKEKV